MIRRAAPRDVDALEGFLVQHAATSMFLRGNLAAHGVQELRHRNGTTFFIKEQGGAIVAVAGCTNHGYLMCQAPDQPAVFWDDIAARLKGRSIAGVTGVPEQTSAWMRALGLGAGDFSVNEIEPLYEVRLSEVPTVAADLALRKPVDADVPVLAAWFVGYHRDTGMAPPDGEDAESLARVFVAKPDARVLMAGGAPVAMTSINARAADTVQIGGVYVPPEFRGLGYGGAVVALHLAELAQDGMRLAVLFAANEYAARAYEAIGFQRVGSYRVALFKKLVVIGDTQVESDLMQR